MSIQYIKLYQDKYDTFNRSLIEMIQYYNIQITDYEHRVRYQVTPNRTDYYVDGVKAMTIKQDYIEGEPNLTILLLWKYR